MDEAAEAPFEVGLRLPGGGAPSLLQETWLEDVRWVGDLTADLFRFRLHCGIIFWMVCDPVKVPAIGTRYWWEPKAWTGDAQGVKVMIAAVVYVPWSHTPLGTPIYTPWQVTDGWMALFTRPHKEAIRPVATNNQTQGDKAANTNPAFHAWVKGLNEQERAMIGQAYGIAGSTNGRAELLPLGDMGPWIILLGKVAAAVASNFAQSQEPTPIRPQGSRQEQTGERYSKSGGGSAQGPSRAPRADKKPVANEDLEDDDFDRVPKSDPGAGPATEKQIKAIYAIGRGAKRLSESQVDDRSVEVFGVAPSELTKSEASQFIDILKGGE